MYEPDWHRPTTIDEALAILDGERGRARVVAGGTDLVPMVRCGAIAPPVLIDLGRIDQMRYLRESEPTAGAAGTDSRLEIGALVTHAALSRGTQLFGGRPESSREGGSDSASSVARLPALSLLSAACRTVGGPQIRARGTVGGNIANASPAADAATALLALEASAVVASRNSGTREIPLGELLVGPGMTALRPDELLVGVAVAPPSLGSSAVYLKEGQRNAMSIAIASVALVLDRQRGRLRISLGSVAPTQVRASGAEALFESEWQSHKDRAALVDAVADAAVTASSPIDDVRASAEYRRKLVRVMVGRALKRAWT